MRSHGESDIERFALDAMHSNCVSASRMATSSSTGNAPQTPVSESLNFSNWRDYHEAYGANGRSSLAQSLRRGPIFHRGAALNCWFAAVALANPAKPFWRNFFRVGWRWSRVADPTPLK